MAAKGSSVIFKRLARQTVVLIEGSFWKEGGRSDRVVSSLVAGAASLPLAPSSDTVPLPPTVSQCLAAVTLGSLNTP